MPKKIDKKKIDPRKNPISTRLTDSELAEFKLSISDDNGNLKITPSDYFRAAVLGRSVRFADAEVERYRAFIASKISNNLNQLTKSLHLQHKKGVLNDQTYVDLLIALKTIHADTVELTRPIRD